MQGDYVAQHFALLVTFEETSPTFFQNDPVMLRSCCSLVRAAGRQEVVRTAVPRLAGFTRCLGTLPGLRPIPVNDLAASSQYSAEEAAMRCKLASLYRLVDARGWSMGLYNHITARISPKDEQFLVNPFGLLYDEVTASNLIKVDLAGTVLDQGSSPAGVNLAGYVLHSAIHETRPDVMCALHVHLPDAIAVSTMQCGLMPITQEALIIHGFAGVSYHDYQGILINEGEKKDIQENLGDKSKVLILRNHGVVVCGESVEEAYLLLDFFMLACQSQVAMMAAGEDGLVQVSSIAFENMLKMKQEAKGVDTKAIKEGKQMQFGQQDFEACMRKLDRAGFNTGYPYQSRSSSADSDGRSPGSPGAGRSEADRGRQPVPPSERDGGPCRLGRGPVGQGAGPGSSSPTGGDRPPPTELGVGRVGKGAGPDSSGPTGGDRPPPTEPGVGRVGQGAGPDSSGPTGGDRPPRTELGVGRVGKEAGPGSSGPTGGD